MLDNELTGALYDALGECGDDGVKADVIRALSNALPPDTFRAVVEVFVQATAEYEEDEDE